MGLNVVSKLSREKEGCGNARVNASSMLSGTVDVHLMELISDESDAAVMRNVLKKIYGESFFGVHKYPKNTRRLSGHLPCITRACQWNSCSGLVSKGGFQWVQDLGRKRGSNFEPWALARLPSFGPCPCNVSYSGRLKRGPDFKIRGSIF